MKQIKNMNRDELTNVIVEAQNRLQELDVQEQETALKAAQEAAMQHGFDLNQLLGGKPKPGQRTAKSAPKYRNPENAEQTWTGKGRQPEWFKTHIEAGGKADDLLIDKPKPAQAPKANNKSGGRKAGGQNKASGKKAPETELANPGPAPETNDDAENGEAQQAAG